MSRAPGHTLRPRVRPEVDAIAALDVSVLQDQLLAPVLEIARHPDGQADRLRRRRARHEKSWKRLVGSGKAAVAFSLYPGQLERPDDGIRCRRHHAAQEHVVRTQTQRWTADPFDLNHEDHKDHKEYRAHKIVC